MRCWPSPGMRSGELQRLRVEDIDFDGNWIHIVSREGAETKSGYSRKVPIHPKLKPFLERLPKTGPWLFTAPPSRKFPDGDHFINTKHLNEDFQRLLATTGVAAGRKSGGFSIHSLRNSSRPFASTRGHPPAGGRHLAGPPQRQLDGQRLLQVVGRRFPRRSCYRSRWGPASRRPMPAPGA